jgi:DNA modification methylase
MLEINKIYHGNAIEVMPEIADNKVDLILSDIPYGTTACKWDTIIPLKPMWEQLKRIIVERRTIALLSQTPFDKVLGASNLPMLKYEWICEKTKATGHLNAKKMPMKAHENALVFSADPQVHWNMNIFYDKLPLYNPQKTTGHKPVNSYTKHTYGGDCYGSTKLGISGGGNTDRYPRSVLKFKWDTQRLSLHPTQKPIAMMKYFIETYSNEGDLVLDFAIGSGTTAEACLETGRDFIGIDIEKWCVDISKQRIKNWQPGLFNAG